MASFGVRGGSKPTMARASMDFPAPGGPTMQRLCPPAAARAKAAKALACPLMSAKVSRASEACTSSISDNVQSMRAKGCTPERWSSTSLRLAAP